MALRAPTRRIRRICNQPSRFKALALPVTLIGALASAQPAIANRVINPSLSADALQSAEDVFVRRDDQDLVLSHYPVSVDLDALRALGASGSAETQVVELALSPSDTFAFELESSKQYVDGVTTLIGHLEGEPASSAVLSVTDDHVYGIVSKRGLRYEIEPVEYEPPISQLSDATPERALSALEPRQQLATALHVAKSLDLQALSVGNDLTPTLTDPIFDGTKLLGQTEVLEDEKGELWTPESVQQDRADSTLAAQPASSEAAKGSTTFDIVVWYTEAVNSERNVDSFVGTIAGQLDQALSNSGVSASVDANFNDLRFYTEDGTNVRNDYVNLTQGTPLPLDGQGLARTAWTADMLVLLVDDDASTDDARGIATPWRNGLNHQTFTNAVVQDDWAAADFTFVHEAGHLLGGDHSIFDTNNNDGFSTTTIGHHNDGTSWMTAMAAYEMCPNLATCTVERQLFFSDPGANHLGDPRGVANESDFVADLPTTASTVAGYRTTNQATPGAPTSVTAGNIQCFGVNKFEWDRPTPVTRNGSFQIWIATNPSFSGQTMLWEGGAEYGAAATQTRYISIPDTQTYYVRVRTCNEGGCGAYAVATGQADYYPGSVGCI